MPLLGQRQTLRLLVALVLLAGAAADDADAQVPVVPQPPAASRQSRDSAPQPPAPSPQPQDTLRPFVAPLPAFFRSLVLPGWGQAILDRKLTAGIFLFWEGVTLGMTVKTAREVSFLKGTEDLRTVPTNARESGLLRSKRAEHQDWLVLLVFNHLFSGLEAYVSAHLWDFPVDLRMRPMPGRDGLVPAIGASIPIRLR